MTFNTKQIINACVQYNFLIFTYNKSIRIMAINSLRLRNVKRLHSLKQNSCKTKFSNRLDKCVHFYNVFRNYYIIQNLKNS